MIWEFTIFALVSAAANFGASYWLWLRKPRSILVQCNCTSHGQAAKEPDNLSTLIADRLETWTSQSEVSMRRNAALLVAELRRPNGV